MQIRNVLFILGFLISCIALCLIFPLGVSLLYGEYDVAKKMGMCLAIGFLAGVVLTLTFRPKTKNRLRLTTREGVAVVGLCWFGATFISALPYYFIVDHSIIHSIFESASGLSTTGASIFSDVEILPKGLLFWRSLTQWMGGLGIIIFSLALLPFLGAGGMQLYKAEATGIHKDKIAPRMINTARSLWVIYIGLTCLLWAALTMQGMSSFEAINHAFTTLATGGFSIHNTSLAAYSPMIQWTITFFMFLAGINFTLHYTFMHKGFMAYRKNEECMYYILINIIGIVIVASYLYFGSTEAKNLAEQTPYLYNAEKAIRDAAFQVISIGTTTGFATVDYLTWPIFTQGILIIFMLMGSCAGSTAGGIKVMRITLLFRFIGNEINKLAHPHAVEHIKINNSSVNFNILRGLTAFFILYCATNMFGALALMLNGIDFVTAFSAATTCLSNVGPGFGLIGPAYNFGFMDDFSLSILSVLMIMGRLELFTVLLLITPKFWRI